MKLQLSVVLLLVVLSAGCQASRCIMTTLSPMAHRRPADLEHALLLPEVEQQPTNGVNTHSHDTDDEDNESDDDELSPSLRQLRAGGNLPRTSAFATELLQRLQIGFYFCLWYALNIFYNIVNKKVLNIWAAPLTVGSIQLGIGALYVVALWLAQLRPRPILTQEGQTALRRVGFFHAIGQLATMVSLGAGPVSFTHIVKALEPFFSAIVSAIVLGKVMRPAVYATLLPVVGGVGYACLKERSFSWLAFCMAMASNVAFALRAVLSKIAMSSPTTSSSTTTPDLKNAIGTHLTSANVFGLVTLSAFIVSIPMAIVGEGRVFFKLWNQALALQSSKVELFKSVLLSGLFHYLNNEVMFLALGKVHPITLAVGNTMKRVFIMVASVIVFQNQISFQAGVGSAVGITGVLLYSITKQYYEKLDAAADATTAVKKSAKRTRTTATTTKKR